MNTILGLRGRRVSLYILGCMGFFALWQAFWSSVILMFWTGQFVAVGGVHYVGYLAMSLSSLSIECQFALPIPAVPTRNVCRQTFAQCSLGVPGTSCLRALLSVRYYRSFLQLLCHISPFFSCFPLITCHYQWILFTHGSWNYFIRICLWIRTER